ncbi:guanine-1-methyltransferase-domain-containing protein [Podospora fimiseda]|uniref:tRNA (guanine(9)-N1)-methyltransferase n=1 Tax=Podospora fimiseda TaxID=252190 RepID=A0AAN7BRB1_9PEZI|nr:guanine-1-methyltransferase-domain-containing protein [Podospora fimiseda]
MATEAVQSIESNVKMTDSTPAVTNDTQFTNGKRKADTELDDERAIKKSTPSVDDAEAPTPDDNHDDDATTPAAEGGEPKMTKNQLKKLRRMQQWEARREDRKVKRKDKRHEKQAKKRAEKEAIAKKALEDGLDPEKVLQELAHKPVDIKHVPITFIIDCDFEKYMRSHEIGSLSAQVVRSYSMNRKSEYQARLSVCGYGGVLQEIFEGKLQNAHKNWKGASVEEGDFVEAAKEAYEIMTGPAGGEVIDIIKPESEGGNGPAIVLDKQFEGKVAPEGDDVDKTIVYLTSDSPYTLERLEANTSYVIGGIVDRNREKGLCYKKALEHKVRHAKLPIGEFMRMQSRFVLTTNQVVEIMAKWLQCGDWAQAFLEVIPKRKGGVLKGQEGEDGEEEDVEEVKENSEAPVEEEVKETA